MIELFVLFVFAAVIVAFFATFLGALQVFFWALRAFLWALRFTLFLPVMIVSFAVGMVFLVIKSMFILGIILAVAAVLALCRGGRRRRNRQWDKLGRLHSHLDRMERRMRHMEDDPRTSTWESRTSYRWAGKE